MISLESPSTQSLRIHIIKADERYNQNFILDYVVGVEDFQFEGDRDASAIRAYNITHAPPPQ